MLIRRPDDIAASEITPESLYLSRRAFMGAAGAVALATASPGAARALGVQPKDEITPEEDATSYNNFYEFGLDKEEPKELAKNFKTRPWTVQVDGLVKKPAAYALDDLLKGLAVMDRTYRHRCVEAWSMVIPWRGVALKDILAKVEPLPSAKYVELTTLLDPTQMPGQRRGTLNWPYREGLRLDEAMHPLTLLATGMYGKTIPNQNGAPLRLVTPWKYGFKGVKSIVRIRLTETQPRTTWSDATPNEYGFFANVNPTVDHPRWSQAKERRIGEFLKRNTLMFNGYADQVASMYSGMDLRKFY
ncbi:MAG: protein-methionine-sulfoxide reductase catalytic subunit MsrP [Gemmatimonadaceae bacterium]|jgi:sulfoxide reductase catalytic subunit YedY|nr:protein-methionine-sulfoxide reductase catalytic subunit MsrP [Gemmatimonadaceae bacterium]